LLTLHDLAKPSLFNELFYSVFTKSSNHPSSPDSIIHPDISELNMSDDELLNVLLDLDTTKAMGSDGIPPIVLQRWALVLTAIYLT